MAAVPMANIIGSPIAGLLLSVRWFHVAGWRWLFIVEGIPAVIFGIVTLFYLTDWPAQARWLTEKEREWIAEELQRRNALGKAMHYTIGEALRRREIFLLAVAYFLADIGLYGFVIWFPTIIKRASELPNLAVGLLAMLPYVAGFAAMLLNGWHSDRTGERRWHTAFPLFLAGAGLALALSVPSNLRPNSFPWSSLARAPQPFYPVSGHYPRNC